MSKSRNRGDYVRQAYYDPHLFGKRFEENTQVQRLSILQRMYIRHLTEIAVNRFKWTGLPHTVNPRFMELTLFRNALSVFYYEYDLGRFLALQGNATGVMDPQGDYSMFNVFGNNMSTKRLSTKLCVPIWANYLRIPDLDIVQVYASKFADLDLTIEINAHNARRNKYLIVDEDTRVTGKNISRQMDEGQVIELNFDAFNSDVSMVNAVDLGVDPEHVEKLHILKVRLYNECMEMLGIKTANQDKKERLVADEVDANEESSTATQMVALNERRAAADKINRLFGLNVGVEYHADAMKQMSSRILDVPARVMPEGYPTAGRRTNG